MSNRITCAEFEILLADLLDGALSAEQKATVENHRISCEACAELARDASGALAFIERVAEVTPPSVLMNRILLEVTSGPSRGVIKRTWVERWIGPKLTPSPRFAMS